MHSALLAVALLVGCLLAVHASANLQPGTFLPTPAIAAAVTVALTVTGQQSTSALIDQRGLFRLPLRALSGPRATGLGLLLAGSLAIQLA